MSIESGRGFSEYDTGAWERLKAEEKPVFAISKARENGVPEEIVQQFGREVVLLKENEDGADAAFRFMKNMNIGEPEERGAMAQKAYDAYMKEGDYGYAMAIAQDAFGKESDEWKRAKDAEDDASKNESKRESEVEDEDVEGEPISISKKATLADLFKAIDDIEVQTELGATHFEDELHDNFDKEIVQRLLGLRDTQEASTISVINFFKEYGYDVSDIEIFLPVKFSRAKKKK